MNEGALRVSVVVPTYNRPTSIERCLDSLAALKFDQGEYEVIVVDDGSKQPPVSAVARLAKLMNVRLLERPHAGPAAARNAGASEARGELLAFTDDDCQPEPDWLMGLVREASLGPPRAVGGWTVNALDASAFSEASQLLVDYLYSYFNVDPSRATFLTSNNMLVPRAEFERLGGFDETFPLAAAEDRDFCARWVSEGHEMVLTREARIHHFHGLDPWRFLRQHFNYGRGAFQFHERCASRGDEGPQREPLAFYTDLLGYPFGRKPLATALGESFLLGLTQIANLGGYAYERVSCRPRSGMTGHEAR